MPRRCDTSGSGARASNSACSRGLASEVCRDIMFCIVTEDKDTALRYSAVVRHDKAQGVATSAWHELYITIQFLYREWGEGEWPLCSDTVAERATQRCEMARA